MSLLNLALASLLERRLQAGLSAALIALGVALAVVLMLFTAHLQNRLSHDGGAFDIVIGAKGSPLQLVLSSLYHIDAPTGNIAYKDAQKWMAHKDVKDAVPLALGDNWKGFRIVGTTPGYAAHYNAAIAEGRPWRKPFEVIVGAAVPLHIGDSFSAAHGLVDGGHHHDHEKYVVVGTLARTGSVIDRLILTDLDSVLEIHGQHGVHDHDEHEHGHEDEDDHDHDHGHHDHADAPSDITALLVTVKSRAAVMNLPRAINRDSALQAAHPATEITRLTTLLGVGTKTLGWISAAVIAMAGLSIFAGLSATLEQRMDDLAVLRTLGYGRGRLFLMLAAEGLILAGAGLALGIAGGYAAFAVMAKNAGSLAASGASAATLPGGLIVLALLTLLAGLAAAAWPAGRAARMDLSDHLSRGA